MNTSEKRPSDYIDVLNTEQEPEKHLGPADNPELEKLLATARLLRALREPALPEPGYPQRLAGAIAGRMPKKDLTSPRQTDEPDSRFGSRSCETPAAR